MADLLTRGSAETADDRARRPLLELLTSQALDEDYAHVARRREADGATPEHPAGPRRSGLAGAVVLGCFGLLVAVAFVQTARTADADDAGRAALIERIESRRTVLASEQARLADLREENLRLERRLSESTTEEQAAEATRTRLGVRTGFDAVGGPGVKVTVENAPGADETALLRDSDLALLANGLWSAGAEAISVNGQRLTAVGAIRNSGDAVEVGGVGVAPPYVFLVVGDPLTLEARFFDTSSGLGFDSLAQTYGFTYDFVTDDDLALPAAPARGASLRYATPDDGTDAAPSDVPIPGEGEPS